MTEESEPGVNVWMATYNMRMTGQVIPTAGGVMFVIFRSSEVVSDSFAQSWFHVTGS